MANTRVSVIRKFVHPTDKDEFHVLTHHSAGTVFPLSIDHIGGGQEFVITMIVLEPCDEDGTVLEQ